MAATLSLRIPDELDKPLSYIAKKRDRSKSYITKEAIKKYIIEAMEDIEDGEDVKKRINDPKETLYTTEELDKMMVEKKQTK